MDNSGGAGAGDRWGRLFADLEQQWEAEARRDLDEEVAGRTRRERAGVSLLDRLGWAGGSGGAGTEVVVRLLTGTVVRGSVVDVGTDWFLVDAGAPHLVPVAAVGAVSGLPARSGGHPPHRRFALADALRALARDRAVVTVQDLGGHVVTGTLDAVLADAVELSEHHADLARREQNVRSRWCLPLSAVALVRATR